MYCPHCGSQQPDNATFCGVCGGSLKPAQPAAASTQQNWGAQPMGQPGTYQQPAQPGFSQPGGYAQPVAAAKPKLNISLQALGSSAPLGKRTMAMMVGTLLVIVFMLQSWFSLPWANKAVDYAATQMGGDSTGQMIGSLARAIIKGDYAMPDMFSFSSAMGSAKTSIDALVTTAGAYGGGNAAFVTQAKSLADGLGFASGASTVVGVIWFVVFIALIAGFVIKCVKGNDVVLLIALLASAALALISIIVAFVMNGMVEGAITSISSNYGTTGMQVGAMLKPAISVGFGSVLTLLAAAATVAAAFFVKE